jgi:hypothetical protein
MLRLHHLTCKHLCESPFACLLKHFLVKLRRHRGVLVVRSPACHKYLGGQAPDAVGGPPHHVLLHHEKESLRVHLARVDLSLKPTHFVAPGHRLALDTVRTEFHQTLIQSIEYTLVVDVHTLLDH